VQGQNKNVLGDFGIKKLGTSGVEQRIFQQRFAGNESNNGSLAQL